MPTIQFTVNGRAARADVQASALLIDVLRGPLALTGTHNGCDTMQCGACTVLVDGEAMRSCSMLAVQAEGRRVTTVEGLAAADGALHPLQDAFIECHGLQCGFCTPGMMMTARWLLDRDPDPDETTIREAISGQICRCTGYENIVRSVRWAAEHAADQRGEST
jgi:carbon-monoxide dehydrogenase small subunit